MIAIFKLFLCFTPIHLKKIIINIGCLQARQTEKERLEAKLAELRNQREKKSQEKVIKAKEAQEQMKRKREQDQDAEMNRVLALSRLMSLKENIETTILGLREEINQEQDFPHFVRHAGSFILCMYVYMFSSKRSHTC